MFNLLMFNVDWRSRRVTVPKERIFEYTGEKTEERLWNGANLQLDLIKSLPCLFCEEGTTDETAYVGRIDQAEIYSRNVSLEISFDNEVPTLQNSVIYANKTELDMPDDFEFHRNHWAVKEVDLYRFLFLNMHSRRQRPNVFEIPEYENIDTTLASAMMPFDASFDSVYNAIQQAANNAGLECRRADDIWENHSIIQDVVALIDRSRIVVCDCSGRNPNVFYEAGIAHTLGRDVILITQSERDIPFDLRHIRYIPYLNNAEGRAKLTQTLQARMQTLLGQSNRRASRL